MGGIWKRRCVPRGQSKKKAAGGRGSAGKHSGGLKGLCQAFGDGDLI